MFRSKRLYAYSGIWSVKLTLKQTQTIMFLTGGLCLDLQDTTEITQSLWCPVSLMHLITCISLRVRLLMEDFIVISSTCICMCLSYGKCCIVYWFMVQFLSLLTNNVYFFVEPAFLVVLCEEELVVIDLKTKETG